MGDARERAEEGEAQDEKDGGSVEQSSGHATWRTAKEQDGRLFSMVQGFFPCPRESGVVKKNIERDSGHKV